MSFKSLKQVAHYKRLSLCGMEELAAAQISAEPSGGILFARKADGDEKRAARQQVLDLFHPDRWAGPLNMLTMPGVAWRFERMVLGMREPGWLGRSRPYRTHFSGVENDRAIYFAGVTQMPGVETPDRLIKPVKRERFPFAELAVKTRHASYFFANVDDLLTHEWVRPSYRETSKAGWDAAWLDYTGPLSIARLVKIQRFFDKYVRDVLIVTALRARWDALTSAAIKKAGGHSGWLHQHLGGHILHDLEYFDTSPMAQFAVCKMPRANAGTPKSVPSLSPTPARGASPQESLPESNNQSETP